MPNWRYIRYHIEERWERLELRNRINRNPKIVIGISMVTGILFLLIFITQVVSFKPPILSESQKVWFYDLNTEKLFLADWDRIPPIDTPSGRLPDGQPAGVKAYLLSDSENPKTPEQRIRYLEKFTPEGREIISSFQKSENIITEEMIQQLNRNRFVRRIADHDWYLADSREGRFILEQTSSMNESGERKRTAEK
jgi:hypothetical protein